MKITVIAEAGINHDGSLTTAMMMAEQAKKAGADIVKYQLVNPETYTNGSELYDIFSRTFLTLEQHKKLKEYCDSIGIEYLCTPSDIMMAKALIEIVGVKRMKVASDSAKDMKLVQYIEQIGMSYFVSTGEMKSANEVEEWSHNINKRLGTILHCVSEYPCPDEHAELSRLFELNKRLPHRIGYSDHTQGIIAPLVAIGAGATTIEKHFKTLVNCVDAEVSATVEELTEMISNIRRIEMML